jgi:hypothetical protein
MGVVCIVAGCSTSPRHTPVDGGTVPLLDASRPDAARTIDCFGEVVACADRTPVGCDVGDGCTLGRCTGSPLDCADLGFSACDQVQGCMNTSSGCAGAPLPCATFGDDIACNRQRGCTWNTGPDACVGTPASCGSHLASMCPDYPGCSTSMSPDAGPISDAAVVLPDTGLDAARPDASGDAAMSSVACSYGGGCDLLHASCPDAMGAHQSCYPTDSMSGCYAAGSLPAGAACTYLNDCAQGLACIEGQCQRLCCSNTDCPMSVLCLGLSTSTGAPLPNHVGTCEMATGCTVLPNSCPSGSQCIFIGADEASDCRATGTATEGMPCGGPTACVAGLACYLVGPGGAGECVRFCHRGTTGECTGGRTCLDGGWSLTVGYCG